MKFKNFVKRMSFLILVMVLFGCTQEEEGTIPAKTSSEGNEVSEGELRMAIPAQPSTLDPRMSSMIVLRDTTRSIYETLVTLDSKYDVAPMLAESFEQSEDGKTYTFYLREGVKFHNGKEMTAEDVVASMNSWKDKAMQGRMLLKEATFEKKDDYTVVLNMKEPSGLVLSVLAATNEPPAIIPKEVIESEGPSGVKEYIGTGPFKFVEWKADQYIHLTKFEDYQPLDSPADGLAGKKEALVNDVYFDFVPDSSTRLNGIRTGLYDIASEMPYENYKEFKDDPEYKTLAPFNDIQYLVYEKQEGIFSDVRIRQAVNLMLDAEEISVASVSGIKDLYRLDSSYMLEEQEKWHSDAGKEFYNQNNMEEAKRLLEEAGYDGEEIVFITSRDYDHVYYSSIVIQQKLEEIGMNVKLEVYDWATVINKRTEPKNWDLFFSGFPIVNTPIELLAFTSEYYKDHNNTKAEQLYEDIKNSSTEQEAKKSWDELQRYAWEYLPVTKISDFARVTVTTSGVEGFTDFSGPVLWNTKNVK